CPLAYHNRRSVIKQVAGQVVLVRMRGGYCTMLLCQLVERASVLCLPGLAVVAEHSCDPFCCRHSDHPPLVWCAPQLQLHYTVHMRTCQHLKSTFFRGPKKAQRIDTPVKPRIYS